MSGRRVDFLTTGLGVGGAETQLVRLAERLQERGWRCRALTMIPPGPLSRPLREVGIPLRELGMRRGRGSLRGVLRLVRLLRDDPPAVLVGFMVHGTLLGRVAGRLAGVPRIVSAFRNEHFGSQARDHLLRWTDPLGHVNVINSRLAAHSIVRRDLVPRRGVEVVPNGIVPADLEAPPGARAAIRAQLGVAPDAFVWLAVARLEPQKDHVTMLRAFAGTAGAGDRLLIAGQGPLEGAIREEAGSLGIGDRVRLLGLRGDVPALLAAADAFVLSSRWEGSPNVLMEAGAAGVPVVATDVGGVAELVLDGRTGLLAPAADPETLAAAMDRLRRMDGAARRAMGEEGARHVRRCFGMEAVTDRWEALLGGDPSGPTA